MEKALTSLTPAISYAILCRKFQVENGRRTMILDVIRQLNWVDIFLVILFLRICYIAMNRGIVVELFKLLGAILSIYLALHYYTGGADFLNARFSLKFLPLEFLDFFVFISLAFFGYLITLILRSAFFSLVKVETVSLLNRWGGFVLGIIRGILLTGLFTYILAISTVIYFRDSVKDSYLGKTTLEIAPSVYCGLWNGLFSKFMLQEKLNQQIIDEVKEGLKK